MALKEIATESRTITITPTGAATWTPGAPTYTEHPSDKVKAGGSKILLSRISWIMPAGVCVKAGYTHTGGATNAPIAPSITKVTEVNLPMWNGNPLAKDDDGNCMGVFVEIAPPNLVVNCTCDFKISNAGQTESKGQ